MPVLALVLLTLGCGPTACETFCSERADCLAAEIAEYGSSWSEWTGHDDRAAFEGSCVEAFGGAEELCEEEDACQATR